MNKRFFITNSFDKPDAKFITELAKDSFLYYVHPELREKWKNQGIMLHSEATPIEDFGIELEIVDGCLYGYLVNQSIARYPDNKPRFWQGDPNFFFRYPGPPGTKTPMNLIDLLPDPKDVCADEYTAIYETLNTMECATDLPFAIAVLEEFIDHAQGCITRIQNAMEGTPPDALESTRFSRD